MKGQVWAGSGRSTVEEGTEAVCPGPGSRRRQAARLAGGGGKSAHPAWILPWQEADLCHEDSGGHEGFRQGLGVAVCVNDRIRCDFFLFFEEGEGNQIYLFYFLEEILGIDPGPHAC